MARSAARRGWPVLAGLAAAWLVSCGKPDATPTRASAVGLERSTSSLALSVATERETIPSAPARASTGSAASSDALRPLDELLGERRGRFAPVLEHAQERRLQLLVSELAGEGGGAKLVRYGLRVGQEYVYPASAIKPFVAVAALRKLELLAAERGEPFDVDTPMRWCSREAPPCAIARDASNLAGGAITLGHELRKLLLASDNAAFGRLYDFVGHRELAGLMARWGLSSLRFRHRLGETERAGLRSPAYELGRRGGGWLPVAERQSELVLAPNVGPGLEVGRAHRDEQGRLQGKPRDFADRNAASVVDLQRLLVALVWPELDAGPRIELSDAHRQLLVQLMGESPLDSENPRFAGVRYAEQHFRPMLPGLLRHIPRAELDYVGKSGRAYGFAVDNAFVRHRPSGRALFVTVALYADDDGVANDDRYSYETVSEPFLRELGEALALRLLAPGGD